jgi:hypothetical protein
MHVGEMWAYRERAHTLSCPVVQAEILQFGPKRTGKVRVRLHGGEYPGLDLWVPRVRLRVPWEEAESWLQDEDKLEAARQASEGAQGAAWYDAADLVFSAYPRPDGILLGWPSGGSTVCITEPRAVAADLGLRVESLLADALSFIDRYGEFYGPASVAERLAHLVVERFPKEVLAAVATEERELQDEALHGRAFDTGPWVTRIPAEKCAEELRKREPVFALVREWCGQPARDHYDEIVALRAEVQRLTEAMVKMADWAEEAGNAAMAKYLRKAARSPQGDYGSPNRGESSLRSATDENDRLPRRQLL